jgi:hypothetical protein
MTQKRDEAAQRHAIVERTSQVCAYEERAGRRNGRTRRPPEILGAP